MHRIWQLFPPRKSLVALFAFLAALAFVLHFVVLTSKDYNWLGTSNLRVDAPVSSMSPMPPVRTTN